MVKPFVVKLVLPVALVVLFLAGCSESPSIVEPGPGDPEDSTTTSTQVEEDDSDSGDVVTGGDDQNIESSTSTQATEGTEPSGGGAPATTVVIDQNSENAAAYTELAASGLVLSLDEQACADGSTEAAVAEGVDEVDAVIAAVQECASPRTIDDFAAGLILAGGRPLPPTESACVSSRLQSTDEYRPFWVALLEEQPFDFLLSDLEVQNRYLDLYAECVSIGRAVGEQANIELSPPSVGCIDDLYRDREFVRITIEADLSGNVDDRERIDGQIATCLTDAERQALDAS